MRDWLTHRVVSSPDDVALVRAEDGEAWTYRDLDRLVADTAGRLAAHGIGEGDAVGVLMPPYVGTVGLVHAAMRLGATVVPLGERLTPRELRERVARADLSAVVCAESTEADALAAVGDAPLYSVDESDRDGVTAVHDADPVSVEPAEWAYDDRLCVLFTSGTTGDPKPVPLTVGNVYSSAVASGFRLGIEPDDRWLVCLALHHMGGLAPVYRSALYGTTVVLRERFDPGGTADDVDRYDVTGISLVPTMLRQMLDSRGTLADSLRVVLLGGAPAPDELLERCRSYSIPVYPTYGMTEAASQVTTASPRDTRGRLDTVGRPLFGTDVTVVDEDGTPVEPGETGEIVVDGPTVTPGYLGGDPGESFGPHGLHTGDVGRLDENGYLYVLNRLDDRIISGGENVEPGEVADVLREHPAVEDAAVVGLDDDVWGERVGALVAVDGAGDGEDPTDAPDTEALVDFARERLAGFKLPRTVAYTGELPRTVSGTVDRDAVRAVLAERGRAAGDGFAATRFRPAMPKSDDESTAPDDESTALDSEPAATDDGPAVEGPARDPDGPGEASGPTDHGANDRDDHAVEDPEAGDDD